MAFADDIVIFGETTLSNAQFMIELIKSFCVVSVNFIKSQVICPENLNAEVAHYLFKLRVFLKQSWRLLNIWVFMC